MSKEVSGKWDTGTATLSKKNSTVGFYFENLCETLQDASRQQRHIFAILE